MSLDLDFIWMMMTSIMKKDVEGRETNNAQIFNGVLSVSWRIVFNKNKR